MRLSLSPVDRERFGCPAELELSLNSVTNQEMRTLGRLGFKSLGGLAKALQAKVVKDDDGNTVDIEYDQDALDAVVWLALRRSGVETDPRSDEFAYDVLGIRWLADEERPEPDDLGKAEDPADSTS